MFSQSHQLLFHLETKSLVYVDEAGMNLALRWSGKWQGKKARDQGMTASACHCPILSSNSPVLLMLLPRRKLIWTHGKTAEPRTHLCPLKKKRHQWRALFQQEGAGAERGFLMDFSGGQYSVWNKMGGYRGHGWMCLSCYDDKMAQPPLCHWPPSAFFLPSLPLVLPLRTPVK